MLAVTLYCANRGHDKVSRLNFHHHFAGRSTHKPHNQKKVHFLRPGKQSQRRGVVFTEELTRVHSICYAEKLMFAMAQRKPHFPTGLI